MAEQTWDGPEVDSWYRDREDSLFKVVTGEVEDDAIEIQHYDGTLAELDASAWRDRRPRLTTPPENWSGSMDMSEEDYREANDEASEPEADNPLDHPDDFG